MRRYIDSWNSVKLEEMLRERYGDTVAVQKRERRAAVKDFLEDFGKCRGGVQVVLGSIGQRSTLIKLAVV
jgi:hypothetical protein